MLADLLFNDGDLSGTLQNIKARLAEEIEATPEEHVLHADEDEWAVALAERYRVEAPVLHADKMWQDPPKEAQVDVSHEGFMRALPNDGGPFYIQGYRVVVHIPFTGDHGVFKLQASQFSMNPPRATVGQDELRSVVEYPHDGHVDIGSHARALSAAIERQLQWSRADIESHNRELEQVARSAIRGRRERVEKHRAHIETTGLPVGPPDQQEKTYIAEAVIRRPAPALPESESARPIALEPVLGDKVFDHILGVIRATGEAMERSPATYADMGEKDRRQVLLVALNSHYRGKASAEAFNVSGKTDILVRHEGSCKVWGGAKAFSETIDQLLRYTAWRDTKLAIVNFVRPRDLSTVIASAQAALQHHPQFVDWKDASSETELRAEIAWLRAWVQRGGAKRP